jgi:hypothetical protein
LRSWSAPLSIAVVALTVPAGAHAASLTAERSCYRSGERIDMTGAGFTPSGPVTLSVSGRQLASGNADATGGFPAWATAPSVTSGQRTFDYTATDQTDLSLTATASVAVTAVNVSVTPKRGNPGTPRRIKARGFATGKTLWAHIKRGSKKRNVKIGKVKGACGKVSAKRQLFESDAPSGVYEVRFDTRRRYSTTAVPQLLFFVTVYRTFASASAGGGAASWASAGVR